MTPENSAVLEPEVECMPRGAIDAYHDAKLAEVSELVYGQSPLITRLWDDAGIKPGDIAGRADFCATVPFLTKDMIRDYRTETGLAFGGLERLPLTELDGVYTSSGTTGDATFFVESWPDGWSPHWIGAARAFYAAGIGTGDYMLVGSSGMRGPQMQVAHLLGAVPIFVDVINDGWPKVLDVIEEYRPAFMNLMGFTAVGLDELSRTVDIEKAFSCFKMIGFAGEPLGAAMREKFAAWNIELLTWSTAGDVALCFECPQHDGLHMWEDTGFFEVLDVDTDEPVEDGGIGELISTSLCNTIAPLIRYRTEDLIRISRETCACGRTHARQWPIGRRGDLIVVRGISITPREIWRAVESQPETAAAVFQVVKTATHMDALRVRVGYDAAADPHLDDLKSRLDAAMWDVLGLDVDLELMSIDDLRATAATGKIQRVVKA